MTSVWKRTGDFEVPLRQFSSDFRVLVSDVEGAYKLGHRDVVDVEVRPYGDFVEWAKRQEPDWDRYAWDGTKVLVEQERLPKSALDNYDNPDLERAGVTAEEWHQLGFEHYVDAIAQSIAKGDNVPPLVAAVSEPIDGRHRALAALKLGFRVAPVIDLYDVSDLGGTKIACGECFDWAYRNLPDARNAMLVHAIVHDPWDGRPYPHAWIERAGRVYDWQSVAKGLGPGARGWLRKKFYEVYQPVGVKRFDYDQSRVELLRHGHYGPWA
jgi:hypothetical protein